MATAVRRLHQLLLLLSLIAASTILSIITYGQNHASKVLDRSDEEVRLMYEDWLVKHNGGHSGGALEEKERRFEIFKDKVRYIDHHNAAADAGETSFRVGLNDFSDLTHDEFREFRVGGLLPVARSDRYLLGDGPVEVDWRARGAVCVVGPVEDQGCGCSYLPSFPCNNGSSPFSF